MDSAHHHLITNFVANLNHPCTGYKNIYLYTYAYIHSGIHTCVQYVRLPLSKRNDSVWHPLQPLRSSALSCRQLRAQRRYFICKWHKTRCSCSSLFVIFGCLPHAVVICIHMPKCCCANLNFVFSYVIVAVVVIVLVVIDKMPNCYLCTRACECLLLRAML